MKWWFDVGKSRPAIERLMEKVREVESGCWEWFHYIEPSGYAKLWIDRRAVMAHRFSYEFHIGPIPDGLEIDHLCRVRHCVNPYHLEPVTTAENVRRMTAHRTPYQNLRDACPNGHPYDEANTILTKTGRACSICKADANRAYYERNRALTIERARQWRRDNPERARELARERQRRYRARKKEQAA